MKPIIDIGIIGPNPALERRVTTLFPDYTAFCTRILQTQKDDDQYLRIRIATADQIASLALQESFSPEVLFVNTSLFPARQTEQIRNTEDLIRMQRKMNGTRLQALLSEILKIPFPHSHLPQIIIWGKQLATQEHESSQIESALSEYQGIKKRIITDSREQSGKEAELAALEYKERNPFFPENLAAAMLQNARAGVQKCLRDFHEKRLRNAGLFPLHT